MQCSYPLRVYQARAGEPLKFKPVLGAKSLEVPCGRCTGCRLERSRIWAMRCMHEAELHDLNCFLTLTYSDAYLPGDRSLEPRSVQLWMKRLRKRIGPVRFFLCGEYGERTSRPHYHALLFGWWPPDASYWKGTGTGKLYRSALLDETWGLGQVLVGALTFESAAYVARYSMKKEQGAGLTPRREILDVETGEIITRAHEFGRMSRRPGLGREWLTRFYSDVFPHGSVVVNGRESKTPRYYDGIFEASDPEGMQKLRESRELLAAKNYDDESPSRRRVKDQVLRAQVGQLKRNL